MGVRKAPLKYHIRDRGETRGQTGKSTSLPRKVRASPRPMRKAGIRQFEAMRLSRHDRLRVKERYELLEMGPVSRNKRPQCLHVGSGGHEGGRGVDDPDQAAAWLEYGIGPYLHVIADRVEHHVARPACQDKVFSGVVDRPVRPEPFDIRLVRGARSGDHPGAQMSRQLNRKAAGVTPKPRRTL